MSEESDYSNAMGDLTNNADVEQVSLVQPSEDVSPRIFYPRRKIKPPGEKTIIREEYDDLLMALTDEIIGKKLHLVLSRQMKKPWDKYYCNIFDCFDDNSGPFIPRIMVNYVKWTWDHSENKFKNMCFFGIDHHAKIYRMKVERGEDVTQIKTSSFNINKGRLGVNKLVIT